MASTEASKIATGLLQGDARSLARAITIIESTLPSHREDAKFILEQCLPHSGNSVRVGITGVPGVGKSTYINKLGSHLVKKQSKKLAVLAIDPSSSLSGGSILGDKTRMGDLTDSPNVFIRPSPTSSSLGGVAAQTRETIILCEAAGFDTILIETVGVGQSETKVHGMVDVFMLLLLPGGGDELQGIKRGIVELSDIVVINKSDINPEKARETAKQYSLALSLMPPTKKGWKTKVLQASAEEGSNIEDSWLIVEELISTLKENGSFNANRDLQELAWFDEYIQYLLLSKYLNNQRLLDLKHDLKQAILKGEISATQAAETFVTRSLN